MDAARADGEGLLYAASNQFDRVTPGDVVWLITAPAGRLTLVGRILVDAIVDHDTAIKRLGADTIWQADYYALPPVGAEREPIVDLDLSEHVVDLRFSTADGEASLVINDDRINPQQLQTMRVLTAGTASRLEQIWNNRSQCLALFTSIDEVRHNLAVFNASAGDHIDRARSLISSTEYWVFERANEWFGPAKFVGYRAMTFELYEAANRKEVAGIRFDGYVTRTALELVLGPFVEDLQFADRLEAWVFSLTGRALGAGINRAKWRFACIEPAEGS